MPGSNHPPEPGNVRTPTTGEHLWRKPWRLSSKRGRAQAWKLPHTRYEGSPANATPKRWETVGMIADTSSLAKAQGKRVLAFAPGNRVFCFPLHLNL